MPLRRQRAERVDRHVRRRGCELPLCVAVTYEEAVGEHRPLRRDVAPLDELLGGPDGQVEDPALVLLAIEGDDRAYAVLGPHLLADAESLRGDESARRRHDRVLGRDEQTVTLIVEQAHDWLSLIATRN